jgi:hypothetical protein
LPEHHHTGDIYLLLSLSTDQKICTLVVMGGMHVLFENTHSDMTVGHLNL